MFPEKVNYIFMVPNVIIDITKYSEMEYVGENVINIPYKLREVTKGFELKKE